MVERLTAQGLIDRKPSPKDRRVQIVRLTAEGRRFFRAVARANANWIAEVFADLTPEGREKLRRAAETHLSGIRQHFTGRLSQAQLRAVASALQVICGPHLPH